MKLYIIWGQDLLYRGEHGMIEYEICEAQNEEQALSFAESLASMVVESYPIIYNELDREFKEECSCLNIEDLDSDEALKVWEDILKEDLDYGCYELDKNKLSTLNEDELMQELQYDSIENFIKKYGKNI